MINEYNNYIEIKTSNGLERMSLEEFSRWACLIEGIESIEERCKIKGLDMNKVDWVQPIALQKYIEERFNSMLHDVTVEASRGLI